MRGASPRMTKKGAPVETGALCLSQRRRLLLGAAFQCGAEDVAERGAGIRRAVLRDGFLLLGDFQRLDRDLNLARLLVELDHAGINLFADGEAVGTLVVAVARQFRALDEGGEVGASDLNLDAA